MTTSSFALIPALHALLEECSVSRAARRIGVTTPSMSRILARLRTTFGDELLVRAGRGLVPTTRAIALRDRARAWSRSCGAATRSRGHRARRPGWPATRTS